MCSRQPLLQTYSYSLYPIQRLRLTVESLESLCRAGRRAGQWQRRFRQLSSLPSLWGRSARRHWPARLYIIIKGRSRGARAGKGRERGGGDLIWRRKHSYALFMSGANTEQHLIFNGGIRQMQTATVYVTHLSSLNVERDGSKCTKTKV